MEAFATLALGAVTLKGETLAQGSYWGGIPAQPIAKSGCANIGNTVLAPRQALP